MIDDYIIIIPNAISDLLCNAILEEYKNSNLWLNSKVGYNENKKGIRSCHSINLSLQANIDKNPVVRSNFDKNLFRSAGSVMQEYTSKFSNCKLQQDSGYELLKYEEGDFYKTHTDSFFLAPRTLSCSFTLNENYEGGEFTFFEKRLSYKLPKGSAILFPSNFMYPHEILPVTKGTRYSIVTWFN